MKIRKFDPPGGSSGLMHCFLKEILTVLKTRYFRSKSVKITKIKILKNSSIFYAKKKSLLFFRFLKNPFSADLEILYHGNHEGGAQKPRFREI